MMNTLNKIPCMQFRGGTSKGFYFLKENLPEDSTERNQQLLKILGSPDPKQIDGVGGGTFVTSKVAIVNKSNREGIDIDYKFIQVLVDKPMVDDKPTCGNLLSAVGVFALERGLVDLQDPITEVKVFDINTGATVTQTIETPDKKINYQGETSIPGVPGTSAPVKLYFENIAGGKTGKTLPTGNAVDLFDGVEATCLDISMPTVFIQAASLGVAGNEDMRSLEENKELLHKLGIIREAASQAMGMGSAKDNVIPKIALISKPCNDGDIAIRYFTPHTCHPSIAVSAGFCLSAGCFIEGTLMNRISKLKLESGDITVKVENPSGTTPIVVNIPDGNIDKVKGKVIRTARLLFEGNVYF